MSMVNVNMSVADNVKPVVIEDKPKLKSKPKNEGTKKTNILCRPEKIIAYYYRIIIQLNT